MASIMHKRRPAIIERLEWALRQPIKHSAKVVLANLVRRADKAGCCWPEMRTIAEDTRSGIKTVERAITILRKAGLVTVTSKPRKAGGGCRNHYRLNTGVEAAQPSTVAGARNPLNRQFVPCSTANGDDRSNHRRGLTVFSGVSISTGGDGGTLAEAVKRGRI